MNGDGGQVNPSKVAIGCEALKEQDTDPAGQTEGHVPVFVKYQCTMLFFAESASDI